MRYRFMANPPGWVCWLTIFGLRPRRARLASMPGQPGERGRQVAFVDRAETGKLAGAVDEHFVPDAARVAVDDAEFREIEGRREIGNDIFGVVGDALALVVVDDGNDIAVDRAAVDGAVFGDA